MRRFAAASKRHLPGRWARSSRPGIGGRAGLGATAAASLALAGIAPSAAGARHAPPDLYDVAMLGMYSDVRETITSARDGTGAMYELVVVRWTARTTAAAPLAR